MSFILHYPPSANHYWRSCRGRVFVSSEAKDYKRSAAIVARAAGVREVRGPIALAIDIYRPRRVGDLDNTLKVLLDSLKGIAFEDDSQIVEISARRFDDADNPRAEILIQIAEREGLQRTFQFPRVEAGLFAGAR